MSEYISSLLPDFKCLAADCPSTCCGGWTVNVDPGTRKQIRSEKGLKGMIMNAAFSKGKSSHIIMPLGTCPFHKRGLCSLQASGKNDLMPNVCRVYPRKRTTIGMRTEITPELSCIEAARLFLKYPARATEFICTSELNGDCKESACLDKDPVGADGDTNDNENNPDCEEKLSNFCDIRMDSKDKTATLVLEFRRKILDVLRNTGGSLIERERIIYGYAAEVHSLFVRNKIDDALSIEVSWKENADRETGDKCNGKVTFFPMTFLNDCILNVIPYGHYFFGNRFFFDLLREYRILFGNVPYSRADEFMAEKFRKIFTEKEAEKAESKTANIPAESKKEKFCLMSSDIFSCYLQYLLIRTCPEAYNDCHLLKAVALPLLLTDLLRVFSVCLFEMEHRGEDLQNDKSHDRKKDLLNDPRFNSALAISSFEKALIHSPALLKALFRKIEKEAIKA